MKSLSLVFLLFFMILAAPVAFAQDAQFWDSQFGTRAQLLGGLVVGAPSDLSSTFYNPAWLAYDRQPGVLLTTRSIEAYTLEVKNGFGLGTEPTSTQVVPSPGFLGGNFTTNIYDDKVTIAYTYLQKVKFDFDVSGTIIDPAPTPSPNDPPLTSIQATNRNRTDEYWGGVTLARNLTDRVFLGITPFLALRKQTKELDIGARGIDQQPQFVHLYDYAYSNYWHLRFLMKAGLAFDYSPLTFGVTLTTPSLGIYGTGTARMDASASGLDLLPPEGQDNLFLASNEQTDLDATFKSPLSVACGTAYQVGASALYFSAEWFNGISAFEIMSPESFATQSHPDIIRNYQLSYSARSIFNWGVGYSHQFNDTFSLYGSYRIDHSILDRDQEQHMMMSLWDLRHITAGASFEFLSIEFTSGIGYSFGKWESTRTGELSFSVSDGVQNELDTETTFRRLKFLIGLNLPFKTN